MGRTFKKIRKYMDLIVILIVIAVAALIFFISSNRNQYKGVFSGFISGSVYYVSKVINYPLEFSSDIFRHYIYLVSVKKSNEKLKGEVSILKYNLNKDKVLEIENRDLKKLLNIRNIISHKTVAATVTMHGIQSWFGSFYINKGKKNGISVGDGVVSYGGILGRVIATYAHSSKVIPITNPKCAFSVVDAKTRVMGIAEGIGNGYLKMKFVFSSQKVNPRDKILTSGLGGIFTAGLLVGRVIFVKSKSYNIFKKIVIKPHKNLFNSKYVLVIE